MTEIKQAAPNLFALRINFKDCSLLPPILTGHRCLPSPFAKEIHPLAYLHLELQPQSSFSLGLDVGLLPWSPASSTDCTLNLMSHGKSQLCSV